MEDIVIAMGIGKGNLPPLEDMEAHGGLLPALWKTWVGACFHPAEFFELVGNGQALIPALIFGVLAGWVSLIAEKVSSSLFKIRFLPYLRQEGIREVSELHLLISAGWLVVLLKILAVGVLVHMFLALFGGANRGLTATLRVIAYAEAVGLISVIPILGGLVSKVWKVALFITGLAAAHQTDTWRASSAVFVLLALFIGFIVVLIIRLLKQ
ncbi:MAG: hypothetical protein DFNUSKGM_001340 [Candidatus Fervidibacter sacchari]